MKEIKGGLRKMKQIKSLMVVCILLFSVVNMMSIINAQEEISSEDYKPGFIKPGNPFYFIDTSFDNIRYNFANNKSEVANEILDERLGETIHSNSSEGREQALNQRERFIERIQDRESFDEEMGKNLRKRLQKHNDVLKDLRETLPEDARQGIDTAIENSDRATKHLRERKFSIPEENSNVEVNETVDDIPTSN